MTVTNEHKSTTKILNPDEKISDNHNYRYFILLPIKKICFLLEMLWNIYRNMVLSSFEIYFINLYTKVEMYFTPSRYVIKLQITSIMSTTCIASHETIVHIMSKQMVATVDNSNNFSEDVLC